MNVIDQNTQPWRWTLLMAVDTLSTQLPGSQGKEGSSEQQDAQCPEEEEGQITSNGLCQQGCIFIGLRKKSISQSGIPCTHTTEPWKTCSKCRFLSLSQT